LTIAKRLGRYHNSYINNNNDSGSNSYVNELENGKPYLDWNKALFGRSPTSLQKLLANANKTTERATKFLNRIKSRQLAYANRSKSIPDNATIRKEYIKCGKQMCELKHGPYYYAYWKDPQSRRLKKKYIGDHMPKKEGLENNSSNNKVL
jgi:hypothetical protein